jgi:hypothetical protein
MADEDLLNGGAEEAAPEDDLRSTILAAVEKQRDEAVPEGETPEEKTAREFKRDQVGRFATPDKAVEREAKAAADPAAPPTPKAAEAPKAEAPADPNAPVANRPPVGWSPKSKADFATLAPHIQADISKREDEIQRGFAKLADYKGLEPYVEQAKSLGKDLGAALKVYEHVDRTFAHQGPIAGLNAIAENIGIDPTRPGHRVGPAAGRDPRAGRRSPAAAWSSNTAAAAASTR